MNPKPEEGKIRTIAVALTIVFLMMVGTTVWAEDHVVTIYFAGTSATVDWSNKDLSCFGSEELLASLYKEQKESETNHKKFINGVGTGGPGYPESCHTGECGKNNVSKVDAAYDDCRGWFTCWNEAANFLNGVLNSYSGDVILNLVGWSRGGILTMLFAHTIPTEYGRIKRINILAIDPAGHRNPLGGTSVDASVFCLNEKVKQYVGIYATDERTWMFGPAIPDVSALAEDAVIVGVPGSHETIVGNNQTDGHASHDNLNCGGVECRDDNFLKVSWVTKAIAKKLLGSSQWGNVEFDSESPWDAGLDDEAKKNEFIDIYEAMWHDETWSSHYTDMRRNPISSILDFEDYGALGCVRYFEWQWELFDLWKQGNRCASLFTCPGEHITIPLALRKLSGSEVWANLEQLTNSPPVALCKDATVPADSTCKGSALIDNGSYDPNGDPITVSQSPSGPYLLGNTPITLTVTDSQEASRQCSGTVTVIDNTPPSVTAPAAVTSYTGPGATSCGTIISNASLGTVVANDNCPGVTVIQSDIPANNFFPVGTTTITDTAKDAAGNTASATQVVTVVDNTPPSITNVSINPSMLWPPNHKMVGVTVNYNAKDNCGQPVCQITSVTSNEPISSLDYAIVDTHQVSLVADREGSGTGRVYTVIITCKDASDNFSSQPVTVTVPHDQGE